MNEMIQLVSGGHCREYCALPSFETQDASSRGTSRRYDSPLFGDLDVAAEALRRCPALGDEVYVLKGYCLAGHCVAAVEVNGHRRGARALDVLVGHAAQRDCGFLRRQDQP